MGRCQAGREMTACRQSATQPLVPQVAPSPTDKKDQRHFYDKPKWGRGWIVVGLCMKMQQICQCRDGRYTKTCTGTFCCFSAISRINECCFDYVKLTIRLPSWLSSTMRDHRDVFPLPSSHPRTNMSTQTDERRAVSNVRMMNIPWPSSRGFKMLSFWSVSECGRLNRT